jgi:hypothetical protein
MGFQMQQDPAGPFEELVFTLSRRIYLRVYAHGWLVAGNLNWYPGDCLRKSNAKI